MFSSLELLSIGVCVLLIIGYGCRRRKAIHIPMMAIAFAIDLGLVLYIEITRDAIAAAQHKMGPLMVVHILMSVTVLGLYVSQVVTGIKKARGQSKPSHKTAGLWLLVMRLGNLITSFLIM